jgi:hypothetical protein
LSLICSPVSSSRGCHEHREQAGVVQPASLHLDQPVHDGVEPFHGPPKPHVARQRQPVRDLYRREHAAHGVLERHLERFDDSLPILAQDGAEKRTGRDVQRQRHHVRPYVERLAARGPLLPAGGRLVDRRGHEVADLPDLLLVEVRLHQPALSPPVCPRACGDAVAQIAARLLEGAALAEVRVVFDQYVAEMLGTGHQVVDARPDGHADDRTVFARELLRGRLWIAENLRQLRPSRSWRSLLRS